MSSSQPDPFVDILVPQNVTCLEIRSLQMSLVRMRSYRSRGSLLIQITSVLIRNRKLGYRDTHTGRIPCDHEGRDEAMLLLARWPANHQKLGDSTSQSSGGTKPADTLISDF